MNALGAFYSELRDLLSAYDVSPEEFYRVVKKIRRRENAILRSWGKKEKI